MIRVTFPTKDNLNSLSDFGHSREITFVSLQIMLSLKTNVRFVHSDKIYSCYIPDSGCL